jgi:hypothetical protein
MDFILRLHFISLQYELVPFALGTAATLIAIAFAVGFIFGLIFALVWNWLSDRPNEVPSVHAEGATSRQG